MRNLITVIATTCLLFSGKVQALGFDLSLSNETANFESLAPVRTLTRASRGGQLESTGLVTLGFFYNELDDAVGHAKLVAVGAQTNTKIPYQLEVGVKAFGGKVKEQDTDIGAVAVVQFPSRYNPIDFKVEAFFTPGITTFGDTDSLLEIASRVSIEIVPAAQAFVGYRLLEIENDSALTLELDDNIHFGMRLQF